MASKVVLGLGQSRALIAAAVREGLFEVKEREDVIRNLDVSSDHLNKALKQLLLTDEVHLQLDGTTCEFEYEGDLLDARRICLLPYHRPDRPKFDPTALFGSIEEMARFLVANDYAVSAEELFEKIVSVSDLEALYAERFGDEPLHRVQLHAALSRQSSLSEADEELLEKYSRARNELGNMLGYLRRFQVQVDEATLIGGNASFDFDLGAAFAASTLRQHANRATTGVFAPSAESEAIQVAMFEIGSMPYRSTMKETLALDRSEQMGELRAYISNLSLQLQSPGDDVAQKIASDITHARGELRNAGREERISTICTFVGLPVTLAPFALPALSAALTPIGALVTLLGVYSALSGLALRRQYRWASIGT